MRLSPRADFVQNVLKMIQKCLQHEDYRFLSQSNANGISSNYQTHGCFVSRNLMFSISFAKTLSKRTQPRQVKNQTKIEICPIKE